jgi:beta-mannosidase
VMVLSSDNMFIPRRIEVTRLIQTGHNRLIVLFESALRRGSVAGGEGEPAIPTATTASMPVGSVRPHMGGARGNLVPPQSPTARAMSGGAATTGCAGAMACSRQ